MGRPLGPRPFYRSVSLVNKARCETCSYLRRREPTGGFCLRPPILPLVDWDVLGCVCDGWRKREDAA